MTNIQMSCEDKLQKIASNFKSFGDALYMMGIIGSLKRELAGNEGMNALFIKKAIKDNVPAKEIIKYVNDTLHHGWDAISPELQNKILKLKHSL